MAHIEDLQEEREAEKRKSREDKTSFVEKVQIDHNKAIHETEEKGRGNELQKGDEEAQLAK